MRWTRHCRSSLTGELEVPNRLRDVPRPERLVPELEVIGFFAVGLRCGGLTGSGGSGLEEAAPFFARGRSR